jgi:2,3-bisphosphoglycerate-independent phosphoglycerate mutase
MQQSKLALLILDGWGIGSKDNSDATFLGNTMFIDQLFKESTQSQLRTDGLHVGLPEGQMGNSEVGHLNIGAGRVIYQDLVKINKSIENGDFFQNKTLLQSVEMAKNGNNTIHLMGLVSNGGIHSHQNHLYALIDFYEENSSAQVYIHVFTDGRDTDPKSGLHHLINLEKYLVGKKAKIASVVGRYYAMDRDNRWERIQKAYNLLTTGDGKLSTNLEQAINESYASGITDEFIEPIALSEDGETPLSHISEGDLVLCFNYRTDRCREISIALSQKAFHEYNMHPLSIDYFTMTKYDESFKNVHIVFEKDNLVNTLGEVIAKNGLRQLRIAETEKYPHVTFFFSGGREESFNHENRILIPSPKVATYDLQPEMSAKEIKESVIKEIQSPNAPHFICLNFANPDMVGHTGVIEAVKKAVETVDRCTEEVVSAAIEQDYQIIIIADHGNSEFMINPDGSPHTAHTTNPVPCFLLNSQYSKINNGKLADLAPTILRMMGLEIPEEMDGNVLI